MSLTVGARLGAYEITAQIGAGGMGEVYRATDTNLKRSVAIKVLPAAVAADADRLARFQREAEVLATLNHPNIAAIYGLERTPNLTALVMELVEGEDLSAHISRGALPLSDALAIARQIADALEAAHENGIIHRDLKPANIKVRADGTVKVLDFGLAKALDPNAANASADAMNSPTLTNRATQLGMIIGTAAYMAPEQARGRAVDRRADIWAFGVVLYEMLAGRRAFEGEDISITLANVMKDDVDWSALPTDLSAPLTRLLRRCLEKDPKKRLSSIGDARLEIDEASTSPAPGVSSAGAAVAVPSSTGSRVAWLVAAAAGVGLAALAYLHFSEGPSDPAVMHVSLPLYEGGTGFLGVSPDGRRVLAGLNNLAVRDLDAGEWKPIESARGARTPFWSPDGRSIGFYADGKLKTVSAAGGPAKELCSEAGAGAGGAWRSDGVILFASGGEVPLRRVSASGGACTPVMKADPQRAVSHPTLLPDGVHYLYVGQIRGDLASRGVYLGSLDEPDAAPLSGKKVLDDYSSVLFAPSPNGRGPDHLLFLRDSNIMAQAFDADALQTVGDPFLVAPQGGFSMSGFQLAAGVGGGTLVYGSNLKPAGYEPVWIDRTGKRTSSGAPVRDWRGVGLSSDGSLVTLTRVDEGLRVLDVSRKSETRVSSDASPSPGVFSRDGRSIVFSSTVDGVRGIYRKPSNGSGKEELVLPSPENSRIPADLSQTGALIFVESNPKTSADIWYWLRPGDASTKPEAFLASAAMETQPQLSPDGRWLAYVTTEGGSPQVTVRQFPSGQGLVRVGVGVEPRWRKDGSELYFLNVRNQGFDLALMAAPMKAAGEGISAGTPVKLFEFESLITVPQNNSWIYAPAPDGQRFLVSVRAESGAPTIHLITNWLKAARGGS